MNHVYCSGCAAEMHHEARACPKCGKPTSVAAPKSKVVAGFLALFLGGIGIHKFYLGQTLWGVIYLVFFWTYIPALVAFVEAIIYFTASPEKWARITAKK